MIKNGLFLVKKWQIQLIISMITLTRSSEKIFDIFLEDFYLFRNRCSGFLLILLCSLNHCTGNTSHVTDKTNHPQVDLSVNWSRNVLVARYKRLFPIALSSNWRQSRVIFPMLKRTIDNAATQPKLHAAEKKSTA